MTNETGTEGRETPRRVQLSRAKGWRMPPNTVVVCRPSKWGNPYKVGAWVRIDVAPLPFQIKTPAQAVALFSIMAASSTADFSLLRGKNLACWCKLDEPCHADVLLDLAALSTDQTKGEKL